MAARVGLTGGIGCGKTTAANFFTALGVRVIAADDVGRELTQPGAPALRAVVECFGADIIDADGCLNRAKLREIVFREARQRKRLEAILHPPIRQLMFARADADTGAYCILDIPLLVESEQYRAMQRVLTVQCERATRLRRLQQQRDMDTATIQQILRTQTTDARRATYADDTLDNNGDPEQLRAQVQALHTKYTALFA